MVQTLQKPASHQKIVAEHAVQLTEGTFDAPGLGKLMCCSVKFELCDTSEDFEHDFTGVIKSDMLKIRSTEGKDVLLSWAVCHTTAATHHVSDSSHSALQ